MKKTLLTLIMYLLTSNCGISAQPNSAAKYPSLEEKVSKSDVIVEGSVIETKAFKDKTNSRIFTSAKIKISKVFKGIIQDSIIELVYVGGVTDDEFLVVSHAFSISKNNEGIFFLKPNWTGLSTEGGLQSHIPSEGPYSFIEYHHDLVNHHATTFNIFYDDLEKELFEPIEVLTGQKRKIIGLNMFESAASKKQ